MATRAVTDEQLTAIADAIRLKTDNPAGISVDDMPLQIGLIESGSSEQRDKLRIEYDLDNDFTLTTTSIIAEFFSEEVGGFFERHCGARYALNIGKCSIFSICMQSDAEKTNDNTVSYIVPLSIYPMTTAQASIIISTGLLPYGETSHQVDPNYIIRPVPVLDKNYKNSYGWILNLTARCSNVNYRKIIKAGHYTFTITHLHDIERII